MDLHDRYVALLEAIKGEPVRSIRKFCRVCGRLIDEPIPKVGNICPNCKREHERERARAYYYKHPELVRARNREIYSENKSVAAVRAKSHQLFPIAQTCVVRGCQEIGDRHHPDETDPTRIVWLCKKHHKLWHLDKLPIDRIGGD